MNISSLAENTKEPASNHTHIHLEVGEITRWNLTERENYVLLFDYMFDLAPTLLFFNFLSGDLSCIFLNQLISTWNLVIKCFKCFFVKNIPLGKQNVGIEVVTKNMFFSKKGKT